MKSYILIFTALIIFSLVGCYETNIPITQTEFVVSEFRGRLKIIEVDSCEYFLAIGAMQQ